MDPVGADAAADHHDAVAGARRLGFAGPAGHRGGQCADGAAKDQGLAEVAVVEELPAAAVGDAALVAAAQG